MDFLEKLNYLMDKNHLNKSTLSKSCDIPYTTVDGWYKRGYDGLKLPTLKKLSNYFEISLDYWADDSVVEPIPQKNQDIILTKKEIILVEWFRMQPQKLQTLIEQFIDYDKEKGE